MKILKHPLFLSYVIAFLIGVLGSILLEFHIDILGGFLIVFCILMFMLNPLFLDLIKGMKNE